MRSMCAPESTALAEESSAVGQASALQLAFERFTETSGRLEARYDSLVHEAEDLKRQLRAKDLELQRSEKLATLGEMAAAIAHEVRNPLGAMSLFISMLKSDVADRPGALEMVDHLERGVLTLNGVVSNILQFSRRGPLTRSVLNLHAIVMEAATGFRNGSHASCAVNATCEGNPFVHGNDTALRQVLHNILENAARATDRCGEIEVSVRDGASDEVVVSISDSGAGIPEDVKDRLFEPFVTTRNEGTGLGLAIVKQIVDHHGGSVEAWNDGGAVFEIKLPRNAGSQIRAKKCTEEGES